MVKHHIFISKKEKSRGDSIIEVLIAVAIFSSIAVAALGIMNKGLEDAQSALETTIVRTEIDAQAERIRFLADSVSSTDVYDPQWETLTNNAIEPGSSEYNTFINNYKTTDANGGAVDCNTIGSNGKVINIGNGGNLEISDASSNSSSSGTPSSTDGGLWVVVVKSDQYGSSGEPYYYDFYVNTCWVEPGSSNPTRLTTTIRVQNPNTDLVSYAGGSGSTPSGSTPPGSTPSGSTPPGSTPPGGDPVVGGLPSGGSSGGGDSGGGGSTPKNVYCVKYAKDGLPSAGGTIEGTLFTKNWDGTSGLMSDGVTYCQTASQSFTLSVNYTASNSSRFEQYGWRKDKGQWGNLNTYYNASDIYSSQSVTVGSDNNTLASNNPSSVFSAFSGFANLYLLEVHPQWKAVIRADGDRDGGCRITESSNCSVMASLAYKPEGHLITFSGDTRKILDALTYSSKYKSTVRYTNPSIGLDNNYIKLESYDDVNDRSVALSIFSLDIQSTAYDATHRLVKWDSSWFGLSTDEIGSLTNFEPAASSGLFYHSIFSSNGGNISSSDTGVMINYRFSDGSEGTPISISPQSNTKCWHVFALDANKKAIYIKNSTSTSSSNNACVNDFKNTNGLIPL